MPPILQTTAVLDNELPPLGGNHNFELLPHLGGYDHFDLLPPPGGQSASTTWWTGFFLGN